MYKVLTGFTVCSDALNSINTTIRIITFLLNEIKAEKRMSFLREKDKDREKKRKKMRERERKRDNN